jgi:hypothetical protein
MPPHAFVLLALALAATAGASVLRGYSSYVYGLSPYVENRATIDSAMRRLRTGMSRGEAWAALAGVQTRASHVEYHSYRNVTYWVQSGLAASWAMRITYGPDDRLEQATVFSDNGPGDPRGEIP